ncbi:MAG: NAD(+)/NADH kinase [Ignavibacteriae bacterium]|nr:NAD(+)/NADH kinase [Ignavibacteria bacterium]MBI3364069.1 NAD(+)/NADH kinase [Ignavibacteriota bacterium]
MIFGIIGNVRKPALKEVSENLLSYLRKRNAQFIVHDELGAWLNQASGTMVVTTDQFVSEGDIPKRCDVLISLGGDGTMLAAARIVGNSGTPILGVNLGKLGFMAEVSVDKLTDCLDDLFNGRMTIEDRAILKAEADDGHTIHAYSALNEIAIDRGRSPRVIHLRVSVDGQYLVTLTADGLIVATPTGSTAYSLASGGPIITPQSGVIAITPISPHTLTARPVVVPDSSVIRVVVDDGSKPVHLTADGFAEGFYQLPAVFTIQKDSYTVKFMRRPNRSYFDVLRAKLMWGSDIRIGPKK